ncbi:MAG: cation:proton antiporter [Prevotella sp.]|nr:cation:proton antiporter [Prevotella sp.]
MAELPALIQDLALILMVAGVVTLVFKRLKQPLVLGYIVAGFLVSPHMPYTASVVDMGNIHLWADIGVMFLLFSLGLDFSFKKILKMGASPVITTVSIIFAMSMLGMTVGHLFGWSRMDCIFLGGMLAMSSTTIIYKAFDDLGLRQQQFASLVMSVLILEDILAIVMMVMLSAIAGGSVEGGQMLESVLRIVFFLVLWLVVGIFAIPLFLRMVRRLMNAEVMLIVSLGLCCAMAVFSTKVGFSSAFGAFIMGSILAETIEAERIEKLVEPVKNLFGAVFFVSVGMLVDPAIIMSYALPIGVLVLTILIGQAVLGSFSFMLGGESLKSAMRCGFSMAQIGEFSFIIASLGLSLGVISDFLYPVVVAVSVITTFLTPYMIRLATPAYNALEHRLPSRLIQALNRLSMSHPDSTERSKWKQLLAQMTMYTVVYGILSSAVVTLMLMLFQPFMSHLLGGKWYANAITGVLTVLLMSPFLRAMVMKKNNSEEWKALWKESNRNHLPLLFTILARAAVAASFVFYVCQHLFHFAPTVVIMVGMGVVVLIVLSRAVKRRSILLERLFLNNLRSRDIMAQVSGKKRPMYEGRLLDRDIHIADFDIPQDSMWAGKTLKQLNLGHRYGVHVSSILRGSRRLNIPDGNDQLFPLDRIQVIGSDMQIAALKAAIEKNVEAADYNPEKREMKLRQLIIGPDSPFIGKTLETSQLRSRYACMVVGIEEGLENLSPCPPTRQFAEGDIIWIVGEQQSLDEVISNK